MNQTTNKRNQQKPIARITEPYSGDRWVLCAVHFGWHHERTTCENPRDDSAQQPETVKVKVTQ